MQSKNSAILIAGLLYGDEGKGSIVDSLTRQYKASTVVRYNGGPQAAHNVIDNAGRHHKFAQFGSGTLAGAKTYLSRFTLINPIAMDVEEEVLREAKSIEKPYDKMYVDEDCIIITPYHVALNQLREISRGVNKNGSCGAGVGETRLMQVKRPDLALRVWQIEQQNLPNLLEDIQDYCLEELTAFSDGLIITDEVFDLIQRIKEGKAYYYAGFYQNWIKDVNVVTDKGKELLSEGTIVFEGAQGVLLDEKYGFAPYNTWSNTTLDNAKTILSEIDYNGLVRSVGVIRSYATRHGNGPFPTESSYLKGKVKELHNATNDWQDNFRVGLFDLAALKYALEIQDVDYLAITHCDQLERLNSVVHYYDNKGTLWNPTKQESVLVNDGELNLLTNKLKDVKLRGGAVTRGGFVKFVQRKTGKKIAILSYGPETRYKKYTLDLTNHELPAIIVL